MPIRLRSVVIAAGVAALSFYAALMSGGDTYASAPAPLSPLSPATTSDSSYNWAGYVAEDGEYTAVSASWVVPEVTASGSRLAADAAWVGIGGVSETDLIQAGTQAIVDSRGGVRYEAWFETLPKASEPMQLEVSPGDLVTASIIYLGNNKWRISIINSTTGKSAATTVSYDSSFSSAEWVEEMPALESAGSLIPLDDFGTLGFRGARAVKNGLSVTPVEAGAQPLKMLNALGDTIATPSVLSDAGEFTVTRTDAPASVPHAPRRERLIFISF